MNNRTLTWIATIILIISIIACSFAFWFVVSSKEAFSKELNQLRQELQQYKFPKEETKDVTVEEAKLYLTVAKYCEEHSNCTGKDGQTPACLFTPEQCKGADGRTPTKGVDYADGITPPCYFTLSQCQGNDGKNGVDGTNGADGANGKPVERRCNPETNQMEWRLQGDESWQPEYNLAPGQTCVEGT